MSATQEPQLQYRCSSGEERKAEVIDITLFTFPHRVGRVGTCNRNASRLIHALSICDIPSSQDGTSVFPFPRFRSQHVETLLLFTATTGNVTYLGLLLGGRFGIHKVHIMDQL